MEKVTDLDEQQPELEHVIVSTDLATYNVYMQGKLASRKSSCVVVTIHDIGSNHKALVSFCSLPCMAPITSRSLNVHVCLPGQDTGALDLDKEFPSMKELSEDLIKILTQLQLDQVILLGVGAGANIACRLALLIPSTVLGIIALQPTAAAAGIMEQVKERTFLSNLKLGEYGKDTDQFLIVHKFGHLEETHEEDMRMMVEAYKKTLHRDINPRNLKLYLESYMKRTDITEELQNNLRCDILLVVGSQSSVAKQTKAMFKLFRKGSHDISNASLIKIDRVGDVLTESPEKVAEAILFFCQGLGMVPTVLGPRSRNLTDRPRGVSMSSADVPNIRRLSLCDH